MTEREELVLLLDRLDPDEHAVLLVVGKRMLATSRLAPAIAICDGCRTRYEPRRWRHDRRNFCATCQTTKMARRLASRDYRHRQKDH